MRKTENKTATLCPRSTLLSSQRDTRRPTHGEDRVPFSHAPSLNMKFMSLSPGMKQEHLGRRGSWWRRETWRPWNPFMLALLGILASRGMSQGTLQGPGKVAQEWGDPCSWETEWQQVPCRGDPNSGLGLSHWRLTTTEALFILQQTVVQVWCRWRHSEFWKRPLTWESQNPVTRIPSTSLVAQAVLTLQVHSCFPRLWGDLKVACVQSILTTFCPCKSPSLDRNIKNHFQPIHYRMRSKFKHGSYSWQLSSLLTGWWPRPKKICPHPHPQDLQMWPYLRKGLGRCDFMKLRLWRWDHPRSCRWVLHPTASDLIREHWAGTEEMAAC